MASYDYREGKARILDIFASPNDVVKKNPLPANDNNFTFDNEYRSWVSSIFVDIRDSTSLFTNGKTLDTSVAKIIRSFTSEVIEILRLDGNGNPLPTVRSIGIRGDCVFGIFATPEKKDLYELLDKAFYINTFISMLNKILSEKSLPVISVGIGLAVDNEMVVKAGRENSGINDLVWIGEAVSYASKLSNKGNKDGLETIVMSSLFYDNIIKIWLEHDAQNKIDSWVSKTSLENIGTVYSCDVVKTDFADWIQNGMA